MNYYAQQLLRGFFVVCTTHMCTRASCLGAPLPFLRERWVCRGVVPSNTKKATSWAVCVFEEWRRERNATATGEQCPLELLEKLTGCRSVTLPSPRHEQPKMSPYSPLQMVPIFPGETGEVNLRFAGDFFFTSGLQQRHTEQNGSPRQDALEHISRPRSSTHDKEAPLKLVTMPTL